MSEQQDYQVTARKWRPAEFESVVGQEHVTQTLRNAIKTGRLHHAYLFTGPRGVGKTTTARILAKALNCQNPGADAEPCNVCDACRAVSEGRSMDVVEIDGASNNSVEDVRKLRDNAKYPPVNGRYKLYIIDEVHMLSTSAFNALLKTLEEPPKHLVFVFATTEPHKVPATILSRCQRFDFRRMQITDIVGRLKYIAEREGFNVDEDALIVIAKKADGSMRDSQSIFDQVISFCGTSVTYQQANDALNLIDQEFFFRVTDMMRGHDTAEAFTLVEQIMRTGYDPQEFLIGLAEHLRNYLSVQTTGSTRLIEAAKSHLDRYGEEAPEMAQGDVIRALHLVLGAQQAIRTSSQPRLRLELALIQLAVMDSTVSLTELLDRIDRLGDGGGDPSPNPRQSSVMSAVRSAAPSATITDIPGQPAAGAVSEPTAHLRTGTVDATLLDITSFPTVAPAALREPAYATVTEVAEPQPSTSYANGHNGANGNGAAVSDRKVQGEWPGFCGEFHERRTVQDALQKSRLELIGTMLRLYSPDDTSRMILVRNKELICEKLRERFGLSQIDVVVGAPPTPLPVDNTPVASVGREHLDHPFIRGIIELLGAASLA